MAFDAGVLAESTNQKPGFNQQNSDASNDAGDLSLKFQGHHWNFDFTHYPLVNVYIPSERSTMLLINGTTHYFDWAIFNSYVTNYRMVNNQKDGVG